MAASLTGYRNSTKVIGRWLKKGEGSILCKFSARILAGNKNFLDGKTDGAFLQIITSNSAAIIPRQFTGVLGAGPKLRAAGMGVFGFTSGGQSIKGFSDTIDHRDIASAPRQAQDIIMARDPGKVIIEITGGFDETNSTVYLFLDSKFVEEFGCPTDKVK